MLKYGYTNQDINEAINAVYNPTVRHEIHLSKATIFVVIFVVASLIGTGAFFYFRSEKAPSELLDLKLELVNGAVIPGGELAFIKEMSNRGSSKMYDVVLTEELISASPYKLIAYNTETIAVETLSSTQTRFKIPEDVKPGDYLLRVTADYKNGQAFAKLPIRIIPPSSKESCFDGIENQNEKNIDCGGVCDPCENETPKIDCNDDNPCTQDSIENGKCANEPITPCCGNNACEENEQNNCEADCKKEIAPTNPETVEEIKELAKSYPDKALAQCNGIEIPILKDTCIGNIGEVQRNKNYCLKITDSETKDICHKKVAELTNDNAICEEIKYDDLRDSCYMTFALDNDDYSVCSKINMTEQRYACNSLKRLSDNINQLNNGTQ